MLRKCTAPDRMSPITNIRLPRPVTGDIMEFLYDALKGVDFLHRHGWLHGDLKPANIGIYNGRAVLLDLDGAVQLGVGEKLHKTPGSGGTIGYLAPEREMESYDQSADVWSMAVLGFELLLGYHPWMFKINPWRDEYAKHRPEFHEKYEATMRKLRGFSQSECIYSLAPHERIKISWLTVGQQNSRRDLYSDVEASMGQDEPWRESQRRASSRPPILGRNKTRI